MPLSPPTPSRRRPPSMRSVSTPTSCRCCAERGIDRAFPIQAATIPPALAGRDVTGRAPTGSGKTLAFGLPIVARTSKAGARAAPGPGPRPHPRAGRPDRRRAAARSGRCAACGSSRSTAASASSRSCGRCAGASTSPWRAPAASPTSSRNARSTSATSSLVVVDEADRMADMGFLPEVRRLLDATSPRAPDAAVLRHPRRRRRRARPPLPARPGPPRRDAARGRSGRPRALAGGGRRAHRAQRRARGPARPRHRVHPHPPRCRPPGQAAGAVRRRRRHPARRTQPGPAGPSPRSVPHGQVQALVATDVAARGVHVEGVACVLHYDLPRPTPRTTCTARVEPAGPVLAVSWSPWCHAAQRKDADAVLRQADASPLTTRRGRDLAEHLAGLPLDVVDAAVRPVPAAVRPSPEVTRTASSAGQRPGPQDGSRGPATTRRARAAAGRPGPSAPQTGHDEAAGRGPGPRPVVTASLREAQRPS